MGAPVRVKRKPPGDRRAAVMEAQPGAAIAFEHITTHEPAGQVIWRPRFDAKLSSAIDSLLELEELGIPVARRFRHRLEEYVP